MAVDTFLRICQKCKKKFIVQQAPTSSREPPGPGGKGNSYMDTRMYMRLPSLRPLSSCPMNQKACLWAGEGGDLESFENVRIYM